MKLEEISNRISRWINSGILPNPSEQNQLSDHFFPNFFTTSVVLWIPKFGPWLALIFPVLSLYKEFIEDGHRRDFFKFDEENMKSPYGGADGRCDLFFRLVGSGIAYLSLIWE